MTSPPPASRENKKSEPQARFGMVRLTTHPALEARRSGLASGAA